MAFNSTDYQVIRASDVSERDGIGVEISKDGELLCEIFRDDTKRTRTVWLAKQDLPLEQLEGFMQIFRVQIDWDFLDAD